MADTTPLLQADQAASAWQAAYDLVRRSLTTYEPTWASPPQDSMMLRRFVPSEGVEPVPFGSLADPVSQAAFVLAPSVQRGLGAVLPEAGAVGPRLGRPSLLANQRGNLGPPPVGPQGEPLPESVVRDEAGNLKRMYHGTDRGYPDFDMRKMDPEGLYGPGIYMTESPEVAGGTGRVAPGESLPDLGYGDKGTAPPGPVLAELPTLREARALQAHLAQQDPRVEIYQAIGDGTTPGRWQVRASGAAPNVRPVYADLKQPFDGDTGTLDPQAIAAHARQGLANWQQRGNAPDEAVETLQRLLSNTQGRTEPLTYQDLAGWLGRPYTNQLLERLGYDGITHIGGANTGTAPHKVVIAFSEQNVYPSFNVDALRPPAPTP